MYETTEGNISAQFGVRPRVLSQGKNIERHGLL